METLNSLFHNRKGLFIFASLQQICIEHLFFVPTIISIISKYMANKGSENPVFTCKEQTLTDLMICAREVGRRVEETGPGYICASS